MLNAMLDHNQNWNELLGEERKGIREKMPVELEEEG